MEKLVSLCKRRGYIFQSSEIYGGLNSCYDYGPLGIELKNNIKSAWWRAMTYHHDNIEGVDASILMHPRVWEASGHVEGFTDPLVDCRRCKQRFRADQIEGNVCANCGGELTEPRMFNLMFKTFMGPVEDQGSVVYLRPETAQGIFVNFQNVLTVSRQKVPFGIAQIGKAFRNEITPGNFVFRTREFEQMEMQFFVHPSEDGEWFERWREERFEWYRSIGIRSEKLRWHEHGPDELAHYAKRAFDIQYEFPFGWQEIEGIHNRTDFDLKRHEEYSSKRLEYYDEARKERYLPYVIETSVGCDRTLLVTLLDAYCKEQVGDDTRVVLKISPRIAPIKAAILPLVRRDGMPEVAHKIADDLMRAQRVFYDESASVGKRYRRQDEIGTPYCFTIDAQTLQDQTVTVRDRDSMQQERLATDALRAWLDERVRYV
ncbi:MAG: glycine--tRNA ligase [Candidatus Krumholzibacteriia bacterium]